MAAAGVAAAGMRVRDAAGLPDAQSHDGGAILVDPEPLFELSPYLYMQFMEPLGVTDSSCQAAWDYQKDDWREDLI